VLDDACWLTTRTRWCQHAVSWCCRNSGFTETSASGVFVFLGGPTFNTFLDLHLNLGKSEVLDFADAWDVFGWNTTWATCSWIFNCVISLRTFLTNRSGNFNLCGNVARETWVVDFNTSVVDTFACILPCLIDRVITAFVETSRAQWCD